MHDTHVHLEMMLTKLGLYSDSRFEDQNSINSELNIETKNTLEFLLKNHDWVLQSTVSTQNYLLVTKLFKFLPKIKYFLGSHPDIVNLEFDIDVYLKQQKEVIQRERNNIIGIGEIGLDYYHSKDLQVHQKQQELFGKQIKLAIDFDLPIMIHCREAFEDTFAVLDKFPKIYNKFLIHCFTGTTEDLANVLKRGGKVAFGGVVTFKSAVELQEVARICPPDSFVLESDLPFLAPVPNRGQTCIPEMIKDVAKSVAKIRQIEEAEVWNLSLSNTKSLFKL
jgi:TatD DNase family protein